MEEHFDVCDPDGHPTGRALPRGEVHRLGLWHRSAHLWLTDGARLLLQRRHPGKETDPGRWDIAVAGHLSAGQTPLEALVRETFEELGLRLDPASLEFLTARPKQYVETAFIDREWQHLFAGRWAGDVSTLVLQPEEVVDARWMAVGDYHDRIAARDGDYVDRRDDWEPFAEWFSQS
jgi:8-oxo-dGTP pyrophosphatase MutT (NUDIX family)